MGLDLVYTADGSELSIRFSMADWETLAELRRLLPGAVQTLMDTPDFGVHQPVNRLEILRAANDLLQLLIEQPHLLPFTFEWKSEMWPGIPSGLGFDTGGGGGIRLPGDDEHAYSIWGGLNRCELWKYRVRPDGSGDMIEKRDMRNETELQTANFGMIQFRKRRAKSSLKRELQSIIYFLSNSQAQEITKLVG